MNDQLVSLEVAKLLKEKGFDKVWCNHIHCIGYNTIPEDNELIECDWRNNVKGQFHLALAPTQSLAQKWLREKHNIHVQIDFSYSSPFDVIWYANIYILKTQEVYQAENGKEYDTYEEALEEGLRVGLMLIE